MHAVRPQCPRGMRELYAVQKLHLLPLRPSEQANDGRMSASGCGPAGIAPIVVSLMNCRPATFPRQRLNCS